jgi:signal transduction histidine kinase
VSTRAGRLAWGIFALTILLIAVDAAIFVVHVTISGHSPDPNYLALRVQIPIFGIGFTVVGAVVASRLPRNPVGWIFLIGGLEAGVQSLMTEYGYQAGYAASGKDSLLHLGPGAARSAGAIAGWLAANEGQVVFIAFFSFIIFLYPDGRFVSSRWRRAAWVAAVGWAFEAFRNLFYGGAPPGMLDAITAGPGGALKAAVVDAPPLWIGMVLLPALPLLALASMVFRYRRADREQRQQVKWVMYASAVVIVAVVGLTSALAFLLPPSTPAAVLNIIFAVLTLTILLIPISAAVAILKYRLYDIDVVISRTLVYGALAAFITAVYVGIVVGIGTLIGSGGQPNLVLSIVATAVVAVAFQPVREWLQKFANRLVYGNRATPYEVLSEFSERVAESYAADDVLPRMARVLAEGTGAASARVWLRSGAVLRPAAAWPSINGEAPIEVPVPVTGQVLPDLSVDQAVPVRHQGELLGALTVTKRAGESLTPVEEKLLADLAAQAGLVLKNVGLTAELLQRLDELRASRQRLVAAQDEERRRLERNLHDGAQQNLVAIKVKLGLAEAFAEKDPARAKELVGQLKADADEALETLRDLARGIYPPLLADKGLAAALESQARKATLPVEVIVDSLGRYSQDLEAAVYFCCLEALQNVQKYAHATHATIRLSEAQGTLGFEVEDDGNGFHLAELRKGSGTQNMQDRIDSLGGMLTITSSPGQGCDVVGSLPVSAAAVAGASAPPPRPTK